MQHQCGTRRGGCVGADQGQAILGAQFHGFESGSLKRNAATQYFAPEFGLSLAEQWQSKVRELRQISHANGAEAWYHRVHPAIQQRDAGIQHLG